MDFIKACTVVYHIEVASCWRRCAHFLIYPTKNSSIILSNYFISIIHIELSFMLCCVHLCDVVRQLLFFSFTLAVSLLTRSVALVFVQGLDEDCRAFFLIV